MDTKNQANCSHEKVKWDGFWDGKAKSGEPTGGPTAICKECGEKLYLTWPEWHKIPKENREGTEQLKNMPEYKSPEGDKS